MTCSRRPSLSDMGAAFGADLPGDMLDDESMLRFGADRRILSALGGARARLTPGQRVDVEKLNACARARRRMMEAALQ